MMVKLYAVKTREGWYMGLTLNPEVDYRYWFHSGRGEPARALKMVLLDEDLPLPIGLRVVEQFVEVEAMNLWKDKEWQAFMSDNVQKVYNQQSGYAERAKKASLDCGIMIWEHDRPRKYDPLSNGQVQETSASYAAAVSYYEDRDLAVRLSDLLEGRALLESEIEAMLSAEGITVNRKELYTALQWGVLQGRLELTNGVHSGETTTSWSRLLQRIRRTADGVVLRSKSKNHGGDYMYARMNPYCRRCGGSNKELQQSNCASCGSTQCWTCTACLNLGRSRSCGLMVMGVIRPKSSHTQLERRTQRIYGSASTLDIDGLLDRYGLAPAQRDASLKALKYLEAYSCTGQSGKGAFLLWAVTGAGKTEMMFPLVGYALAAGKRVCIATPRRDVVLELKPRIEKAFAEVKVATLYGGSAERWVKAEITLATTHQLLRFAQAFDLVVVDELDAFPYHNNPMLQHAAEQACRVGGTFVYLSATPPMKLQRAVKRGTLAQAIVPVRYHRHPLPVPERMAMPGVARCIARGRMPRPVVTAIGQSVARGAQVFVFVARIRHIDGMVRLLRAALPQQPVAGTSAADAERTDKVLRFRQGDIRVLVTTTILERGVTVPRSDVFILDADDRLFDTSSLVQMAGRAGRSKDDPHGRVVYAASQWTSAQRGAVRQIRRMNRLAKRGGYLLGAS